MANPSSLPLQEQKPRKNTIPRVVELIILFLLLSLLVYRLFHLGDHGWPWVLAFCCESWFTLIWILSLNNKWNPVYNKTYPERLLHWKPAHELPSVDMFVTTADPSLNRRLSPAPFRYYNGESSWSEDSSLEFQDEWKKIKDEYEKLCQKIEEASQTSAPWDLTVDFAAFSHTERRNHPTIIKVIWENKEDLPNGLPHLVYISREKLPKHPHHFKAGAMNVLTRVSGVMTNAPFMLNVDCDMYANNPQMVLHAMCMLLGAKNERDSGFVQYPQCFYDGLKDDPFGNQLVALFEVRAKFS
ncbi:unnamed protein product [Ilex paraguariensis]|uniref:Cellulose synthase n=1 Tax=Ilex paraguariensis TaxID=185542 RepID=A0ABC8RV34_9AQUA